MIEVNRFLVNGYKKEKKEKEKHRIWEREGSKYSILWFFFNRCNSLKWWFMRVEIEEEQTFVALGSGTDRNWKNFRELHSLFSWIRIIWIKDYIFSKVSFFSRDYFTKVVDWKKKQNLLFTVFVFVCFEEKKFGTAMIQLLIWNPLNRSMLKLNQVFYWQKKTLNINIENFVIYEKKLINSKKVRVEWEKY